MKSLNSGKARHVRVGAVVAYPAVSVALVVSAALALSPFSPSQAVALAGASIPLETTAPVPTTTSSPSATSTATPTPTTAPSPTPIPSPSTAVVAAPGPAPVDHHVVARIEGSSFQADYLPVDVSVPDAEPFQRFRVRFQLHNAGSTPITVTPRLEYRVSSSSSYTVVPEKPLDGIPFHMAREWVPSLGLTGGTMQGLSLIHI